MINLDTALNQTVRPFYHLTIQIKIVIIIKFRFLQKSEYAPKFKVLF